ncbi:hypothetical protein SPPR111872_03645 [Sphingobacterium prati]
MIAGAITGVGIRKACFRIKSQLATVLNDKFVINLG